MVFLAHVCSEKWRTLCRKPNYIRVDRNCYDCHLQPFPEQAFQSLYCVSIGRKWMAMESTREAEKRSLYRKCSHYKGLTFLSKWRCWWGVQTSEHSQCFLYSPFVLILSKIRWKILNHFCWLVLETYLNTAILYPFHKIKITKHRKNIKEIFQLFIMCSSSTSNITAQREEA